MNENKQCSILFPFYESNGHSLSSGYKQLSQSACHDLGLDTICRELTNDSKEQNLIMNIISNMTPDPAVALYRQKVFADILNLPDLRKQLSELFDKIEFIRDFGNSRIESDEKLGFWHHMHKLASDVDEINTESGEVKASSLIMKSDNGKRSFKLDTAPPEGMSYAKDIAEKYGVTYEMLTNTQ